MVYALSLVRIERTEQPAQKLHFAPSIDRREPRFAAPRSGRLADARYHKPERFMFRPFTIWPRDYVSGQHVDHIADYKPLRGLRRLDHIPIKDATDDLFSHGLSTLIVQSVLCLTVVAPGMSVDSDMDNHNSARCA